MWLAKFWAEANNKLHPDKPRLPLKDSHIRYAQRQLALIQNVLKVCSKPMLGSYYGLDRSEPNHTQTARNLTLGEKWLLLNLANNEFLFQHKIISKTIAHAFFRSLKAIGVKHKCRFSPLIPIAMIAYACAIIHHLIKLFEVNDDKASDLKASGNADDFCTYMGMLWEIGEKNPGVLVNIWSQITIWCL
ncbi:hypothetical protein FRC06_004702 [Ceratobasidium sp. 370]|nr:hypothetical protein FRC06_004702 [Ceratobasidium sp. 370]